MSRALEVIADDWALCTKCDLHQTRQSGAVVIGEGPSSAEYMLIYDMPSKEDMRIGAPMRNPLDVAYVEIFEAAGLSRELLYIAPLVGCSPLVMVEETQTNKALEVVRPPKPKEVDACQKRIHDIIYAVDPRMIFIAGMMAFKTLVPGAYRLNDNTLYKAAGKLFVATIPGRTRPIQYPVMAVMGPMDVMKNPSAAAHGPIGITAKAVENAIKYVSYVERSNEQKEQD